MVKPERQTMTEKKTENKKTKSVERNSVEYKTITQKLFDAISSCATVKKHNSQYNKGFSHEDMSDSVRQACLDNGLVPQMELKFEKDEYGVGCHALFIVENKTPVRNSEGHLFNERKLVCQGYAYSDWQPKTQKPMTCGSVSSYASKYAQQKGFFVDTDEKLDFRNPSEEKEEPQKNEGVSLTSETMNNLINN